MSDVARLLSAIESGDPHAAGELLPLVYDELRRLAARKLADEPSGQTLQPTALVHEAYLRLVATADGTPLGDRPWNSLGHFYAAAAEAVRRILVEASRRKRTAKRGGGLQRRELPDDLPAPAGPGDDVLGMDEALTLLEQRDPTAARLVALRYFAGLSHQEAAAAFGITRRAADRLWALARAWLYRQMTKS